uniref:Sushi domain-containing protein 4-like n=1 Tax=Sinocyclocheilus anshuiensis TaxID=1608454 RepID=A0A671QVH6_9TELE
MFHHGDKEGKKSAFGHPVYSQIVLSIILLLLLPPFRVTAFPVNTAVETFCKDPGVPEHGIRTPSSGLFFENSVARFSCVDGYSLKGPAKIICTRFHNGSVGWKPSLKPVCLSDDCLPPFIEDADVTNKTYRPGDSLIISCCLRPLIPPHSYMNISETEFSVPVGTVVHYQCFPGYNLEGPEFLECMYNLIWSNTPPRCLDVEACSLPPMIEHGDYMCHPQPCDRYIHGTVVEYYCYPGYSLANDYKYITCQYGQWFPQLRFYCIKDETTWPGFQDSLLTTWKVVACTATSVLLALLLVITGKMFHFKCKSQQSPSEEQAESRDPNILVVDGVAVPLPSYEEAISGTYCQPPNDLPPAGLGSSRHSEEQNPPSYPGHTGSQNGMPLDTGEAETYDSISDTSECLQGIHPSSSHAGGLNNMSEKTNAITSMEETASTSPSIDIADEIPLVEDGEVDC